MYSEIIPEELQYRLMALQDILAQAYYEIGDITLEIIRTRPDISRMEIYSAVGVFVGKASRTVREYASVAEYYNQADREKYEVLSFDHLKTALRYDDTEGMLDWAIEQVDELNRPASVDAMEAHFGAGINHIDPVMELREATNRFKKTLHEVALRAALPPELIEEIITLLKKIEEYL